MNNKIKHILNQFLDSGYEAFIIGGYVRDFLLGRETYDVDIATSAHPNEIIALFDLENSNEDNYGTVSVKDSLYNYDITTYRKESKYINRHPMELDFVTTIEEDVLRRDFTINALYLDVEGSIYDLVDGRKDLNNKIVRVIGNINDKMVEDPLRILRAIRFATILDFTIESNLLNYIRQNKQLLKTLSNVRRKEELDKIFNSPNVLKGLDLIKILKLEDVLEIKINGDIKYTSHYLGIWAQIEVIGKYNFKNSEVEVINALRQILKYGKINQIVLYQYGLFASILAGEILGVEKSEVSRIYNELPIYSVKDIAVNGEDIMNILNIEPSEKIKNIISALEISIINGELENNPKVLEEYIINNWR